MSSNRVQETKLRQQQELASEPRARSFGRCGWKIVGAVALVLAATAVITSLHDIRRYIRISAM